MNKSAKINIGILIALEEEFAEFYQDIKETCTAVEDKETGRFSYLFEISSSALNRKYTCAATFIGDMGPLQAQANVQRFIGLYAPQAIVMIGISGGIDESVRIGDVVIASQIDAYYENLKATDKENSNEFELQFAGDVYKASMEFINFAKHFRFAHFQEYEKWQNKCKKECEILIPNVAERTALITNKIIREDTSIHKGHIASGPILGASDSYTKWLKKRDRKLLALEMESAGLMSAVYQEITPRKTLILRAISDYADERKSEMDNLKNGVFRQYAMRNAIRLFWTLIEVGALSIATQQDDEHSKSNILLHSNTTIHNLGSRPDLVGRADDINHFLTILNDTKAPLIIYGSAGIGKTSIAIEIGYQCIEASEGKISWYFNNLSFNCVLYFTARQSDLLLEDILDGIGRWTGNVFIVQLTDSETKYLETIKLLGKERVLVIIDNYETISSEKIKKFVNDVPYPSRVIITSRRIHSDWLDVKQVELAEMRREDAAKLIERELSYLYKREAFYENLTLLQKEGVIDRLQAHIRGNPLAIEWAIGQLRAQPLETVIALLSSAQGDLFENLFDRSWQWLDKAARECLCALTIFVSPPSSQALESVARVKPQESGNALSKLVQIRIIEANKGFSITDTRYSLHPLAKSFASAKIRLIGKNKKNKYEAAFLTYYLNIALEYGGPDWENPSKFQCLELEKENIFQAATLAFASDNWPDVISFAEQLRHYTLIYGYWGKRIQLCEQACVASKALGNDLAYGRFHRHIGWTMVLKGQLSDAQKYLTKALQVADETGDTKGAADAIGDLAEIARLQLDLAKARELRIRALELSKQSNSKRDVYVESTLLAQLDLEDGHLQSAKTKFQQSLETAKSLKWHRAIAYCLHWLGDISRLEHDFLQASLYYDESLRYLIAFQDKGRTAMLLKSLSFLAYAKGDLALAKQKGEDALSELKRLGLRYEIQEIQDLVDSL